MQVGVKQVLLRSKGEQKGEGLPPGAPCGVVYGQVSALRSVDLPTASRLRRADTPICKEENRRENRLRLQCFPEHIHPAMAPLIFREKLFKQTEPLLLSPIV
jgi:hypothetical protein